MGLLKRFSPLPCGGKPTKIAYPLWNPSALTHASPQYPTGIIS